MKYIKLALINLLIITGFNLHSQDDSYIIKRGDVIDVIVMEHPEFSLGSITVLPDGFIQYPALGSIKAAGLTSKMLMDTLQVVLTKYVVNPIVTVFVRQITNQSINVFGYVNKPGQYIIYENKDLLTAIGMAGGIKNFRKVKKVYIIRQNLKIEEVKIKHLYKKEQLPDSIPLIGVGDTIYIKEPNEIHWSKYSFFAAALAATATILNIFL